MAFLLRYAALIHVPKTGGTWCHQVFFEQGLLRGVLHSPANYPHPSAAEVRSVVGSDLFLFCFVRHPGAWLRSWWSAATLKGGRGVDRMRFAPSPWAALSLCVAPTFQEFLDHYLATCPGIVGHLFDRYTDGVSFVGRYETLLRDLHRGCERAGVPLDPQRMVTTPANNLATSLIQADLALVSPATARAVCDAERACLDRYYPNAPIWEG